MHDRTRLREALAAALAAAHDARAPDRVLALLQGAYRSLESTHFVDADMIRWAEASLGAWRRWSTARDHAEHRLLVVDPTGALGDSVRAAAATAALGEVEVVRTRTATLEVLATHAPTAIVFDLDGELVPTVELLDWLATEFPHILRVGCTASPGSLTRERERFLYHAIVARPPSPDALRAALVDVRERRSFG